MNEQDNELDSENIQVPDDVFEEELVDDVFGLLTHAESHNLQVEVVIVKSKAIAKMISDGMSEDEAEEHWTYNIAGSYGSGSYSCVDDTIDAEFLTEMVNDPECELCDPPFTGRDYIKKPYLDMLDILSRDMPDGNKIQMMKEFVEKALK